jgi:hypothetical protein
LREVQELYRRRTGSGGGDGAAALGAQRWRKWLKHGRALGLGVKRRGGSGGALGVLI